MVHHHQHHNYHDLHGLDHYHNSASPSFVLNTVIFLAVETNNNFSHSCLPQSFSCLLICFSLASTYLPLSVRLHRNLEYTVVSHLFALRKQPRPTAHELCIFRFPRFLLFPFLDIFGSSFFLMDSSQKFICIQFRRSFLLRSIQESPNTTYLRPDRALHFVNKHFELRSLGFLLFLLHRCKVQ